MCLRSVRLVCGLPLCLALGIAHGGIVEMPSVEETPSLQGTSIYENYNIPSAGNRLLDPVNGPRLWVKKITVQGVDDFPELGIRTVEVEAYIERLRYDLMRESEIEEYGYSDKELAEIANLLNKIDVDNNYEHVSTPDLQRFIWLVRSQKERRGLSMGEIENIAEKVKDYYRSRGLQLAEAHLPRQAMRDGVVTIIITPSKLGAVEVADNELYDSDTITGVFDDMLAEPVTFDRVSERSYLINDYPGLSISGQLHSGYQVGDSILQLKTVEERAYEGTLRLDNHGSDQTGKMRGFVEFLVNNPTGAADRLNLSVLQSTSPDNATYGKLGYRLPLFDPRWHLSLSASTNQFILDQTQNESGTVDQIGITGKTKQTGVDLEYTFRRSRETSIWFRITRDTTRTILDSGVLGNLMMDDEIENLRLSMQFDLLNSKSERLHLGSFTASSGEFIEGARGRAPQYARLNADYTLMTFVPLAWFDTSTRLLIKTELQYSTDALPSAEQKGLASPTRVRAYPVNQFSADSSAYLGLEWVFNTPDLLTFGWFEKRRLAQKIQPILFINAASGKQNAVGDTEDVTGTLVDAGIGLQYGFGGNISGNLQFAFPVREDFNQDTITVPDDRMKVVFDFQYQF